MDAKEYQKYEAGDIDDKPIVNELVDEMKKLKAENKKIRVEWFKKGQMSVKRKNKSGCCCIINDDDEIETLCLAHSEYIKAGTRKLGEAFDAAKAFIEANKDDPDLADIYDRYMEAEKALDNANTESI